MTSTTARSAPPVKPAELFRRRSRSADLLTVIAWTSGAAAAALFLGTGGAAQFGTFGAATTSLGILAGLVGSDLVLVMLVLAARVPIIDRAVGHDHAMQVHRQLGKPALYLLLAHAVLLLIGYGIADGINPVAEIFSMITIADMPLAFLSMGLFIAVVVSSLVAVRRKFRYEFWYVIHLLSYAAVIFGLPHQLSLGMLAKPGFERNYWIALYFLALGAIVVFRVLDPMIKSARHGLRVSRVDRISHDVVAITLSGRRLRALGARGGQFFVWRFWTGRTWYHSHPISLSAVPTDRSVRITVRALGRGTSRLAKVPIGTRVSLEGPYGIFTDAARTAPRLAIVAAGIGVTPVRALLEQSRLRRGEASILLRASSEGEAYHWDELRELSAQRGASYYTSIGTRGPGKRGWLAAGDAKRGVTLGSVFPDLMNSDLYICGPQRWTDLVEDEAKAAGVPRHQIHVERFDW